MILNSSLRLPPLPVIDAFQESGKGPGIVDQAINKAASSLSRSTEETNNCMSGYPWSSSRSSLWKPEGAGTGEAGVVSPLQRLEGKMEQGRHRHSGKERDLATSAKAQKTRHIVRARAKW